MGFMAVGRHRKVRMPNSAGRRIAVRFSRAGNRGVSSRYSAQRPSLTLASRTKNQANVPSRRRHSPDAKEHGTNQRTRPTSVREQTQSAACGGENAWEIDKFANVAMAIQMDPSAVLRN